MTYRHLSSRSCVHAPIVAIGIGIRCLFLRDRLVQERQQVTVGEVARRGERVGREEAQEPRVDDPPAAPARGRAYAFGSASVTSR